MIISKSLVPDIWNTKLGTTYRSLMGPDLRSIVPYHRNETEKALCKWLTTLLLMGALEVASAIPFTPYHIAMISRTTTPRVFLEWKGLAVFSIL